MKRLMIGVAAIALSTVPTLAGKIKKPHETSDTSLERGKYLVEDVGLCGDCHTPRNEKGQPVREQWLRGSTLDFKPTVPIPDWADKAVCIAGLPGWEKGPAIKFMMTGIAYNGLPARPPMPQYRFNREDAEAVVAYLKSLEPAK
jgi:Cytochrome c